MAKCKGKSMWSYLTATDDKYTPCWRTDLIIDATEAQKLMELGLKKQVKRLDPITDPEAAALGDYKVKFVRYVEKRGKFKGQKNQQPELVDADNQPFEGILGNGSDIIVRFNVFKWKNNFGEGVGADLEGVKVINLVPYEMKSDEEESVPESATAGADEDDKW